MASSLYEPDDSMALQFCRSEAYLRQEYAQVATSALRAQPPDGTNRLEELFAKGCTFTEEPRAAHTRIAASAAHLPITPEMAWALPQLLKRIQLLSPGVLSTSAALRSLIRMPESDEQFAKAFADSGFLSCDKAMEPVRWKYDISDMMAMQHAGSAWEILEYCRILLTRHRTKQPLDYDAVLNELQTLISWFPEIRTIQLLHQLYARLHVLHTKSVLVVQCWLDWRAGTAFQGIHHA